MYCTLCQDIGAENLLKDVKTPNLEAYVNSLPPYPHILPLAHYHRNPERSLPCILETVRYLKKYVAILHKNNNKEQIEKQTIKNSLHTRQQTNFLHF